MFEYSEAADKIFTAMKCGLESSQNEKVHCDLFLYPAVAYLTDIQIKKHLVTLKCCVTSAFVKNRDDDDDCVIDV